MIDYSGNIIQDVDYESIIPVGNLGYFCIREGLMGYIDSTGQVMITPRFDKLDLLENGTFIATRNNKSGIISLSGETLIPVIYDKIIYNSFHQQLWGCVKPEWQNL